MQLLREVSQLPLGFGGGAISGEGGGYGFGNISEAEAVELLRYAYELGYRIFDTAPAYGFGTSETRMGKAFGEIREKVFLVSKCGVDWHDNMRINRTNDPKVAGRMLEESLKRFGSDYIDLYMIHWPDPNFDIRETMEVLAKAKEEGKIKHIGLCNTTLEDLSKAKEVAKVDAVQSQLNLFEQDCMELFDELLAGKISFMSWGTLDKGILTKRVDRKREENRDYDASDCRRRGKRYRPPLWSQEQVFAKLDKLERVWPLLEEKGHTPLEMALGHNLSYPACTTCLVGARTREQLEDTVAAVKNLPSRETVQEVLSLVQD